MTTSSTSSDPLGPILAQFVADLDDTADPARLLADYRAKYPQIADKLERIAALNKDLRQRRAKDADAAPARLGEFRIVRRVAVGGMGTVYEAVQEPLNRRVAVKTIRRDSFNPQGRDRFLREQSVLASFHQTHIVPIHTAGQVGDLQYFAMPYIEGVTLQNVIKSIRRQQPTSPGFRTPNLATLARDPYLSTAHALGDTDLETRPAKVGGTRQPPKSHVRLSTEYFRSVASVMADAADAFEYVHGLKILHRDLKPSNLMVDSAGQCWIIDFGLAAYLQEADRTASDPDRQGRIGDRALLTSSLTGGDIIGTPSYMAPEQWAGRQLDRRSDVWGLGATLYEMLTLQPAFAGESAREIEQQVLSKNPLPPHHLIEGVPRDLSAVCLKALKREPTARYQSAGEFAADLRRWLNYEPVMARRTRLLRRILLWIRRNRAWAAAIAIFLSASAALAAVTVHAAHVRERQQHRERLLQQVQNVRLLPHQVTENKNWYEDGQALVREAVQLGAGRDVQDQAAGLLSGVNARLAKWMPGFRASSIAIDAEGRRVLIGGTAADEARIWDSRTDLLQLSGLRGSGPVAFSRKGRPWQLVGSTKDRFRLILWDVASRQLVRELIMPQTAPTPPGGAWRELQLFLTADGGFAAALAIADEHPTLTVWDARSGKVLRQITQAGRELSAVAVSPDGALLAAGDRKGQVSVWPLPSGDPLALPSSARTEIDCLSFGPNPRAGAGTAAETEAVGRWLLAGGHAAGKTTIWDLARRVPITECRGSYYNIYALAFSPDGVTLATTGRAGTKLWDVATGRMLLDLHYSDDMTGIAFSRDARKLAISMERTQNPPELPHEGMQVWDLEDHRGVQSLRGLDGQIAHSKVCFAGDARRIAAMSLDWRIAIWDLPSGFLRRVLDVAPGLTADNSALGFSHDGRKFAYSAGSEAKLLDLETGRALSWQLPKGLADTLVFDASDKRLWLFRVEADNRATVCRVRDLLAGSEHDLRDVRKNPAAWETREFDAGDVRAQATPDGKYFVAEGRNKLQQREKLTRVFDCTTGHVALSLPSRDLQLEVTGRLLAVHLRSGGDGDQLIKCPTGELVDGIPGTFLAIGPEARLLATKASNEFGYSLRRRDEMTPLVTLGIDAWTEEGRPTFSQDGALLAWGNRDGTVTVCHLEEVQRRLATMGLGW